MMMIWGWLIAVGDVRAMHLAIPLLLSSCAFHPTAVTRLAHRRSSIVRAAASALPIQDAPAKVLYDGQCMVTAPLPTPLPVVSTLR